MGGKVMIPKKFNDLALRRVEVILKSGVAFDKGLCDILAHAYTCGFIDCCESLMLEKIKGVTTHDSN